MADWTLGYSAAWDVSLVDPDTWADGAPVGGVMSVSVSRDSTDAVPLIETGTMRCDGAAPFEHAWCRIYMRADQDASERVPMATLLFERGRSSTDHGGPVSELTGYSVLKPAADVRLPRGAFAKAGIDGAALAASMLRGCTPAPVVPEGAFTLVGDLVFDLGASVLSAVWQLLGAAGWCIQIDGDGTVRIRPKPSEPALELDRAHASLLVPGVDMTLDLSDVPNRYFAIDGESTAVAVNDDPALAASRARRGRWVDAVDPSPTRVDGETLQGYAERRLAEASTVAREYSYTREFWPGCTPFSLVRASLPEGGISGDLRIARQSLECGKGVTVSETACEEVRV